MNSLYLFKPTIPQNKTNDLYLWVTNNCNTECKIKQVSLSGKEKNLTQAHGHSHLIAFSAATCAFPKPSHTQGSSFGGLRIPGCIRIRAWVSKIMPDGVQRCLPATPGSAKQLTEFLSPKACASWPGQPSLAPLCYVTMGKFLNFSKNLPNQNSI